MESDKVQSTSKVFPNIAELIYFKTGKRLTMAEFDEKWQKDKIDYGEDRKFYEMFGFGFTILSERANIKRKLLREKIYTKAVSLCPISVNIIEKGSIIQSFIQI